MSKDDLISVDGKGDPIKGVYRADDDGSDFHIPHPQTTTKNLEF